MKRWFAGGDKGQTDSVGMSKQKEAALQLQLAERNLENLALRQQAYSGSLQASPHIAQVNPHHNVECSSWVTSNALLRAHGRSRYAI